MRFARRDRSNGIVVGTTEVPHVERIAGVRDRTLQRRRGSIRRSRDHERHMRVGLPDNP